jgi:hypothetical protein
LRLTTAFTGAKPASAAGEASGARQS